MVSPLLQSALSIVLPVIFPSAGHLNLFYSLGILYISGSISKGLRRNRSFVWSVGVHQYRNDRYLLSGLEFVPLGYIPRITIVHLLNCQCVEFAEKNGLKVLSSNPFLLLQNSFSTYGCVQISRFLIPALKNHIPVSWF